MKRKNEIIGTTLALAIVIVVLYLLGALVSWSLSIGEWHIVLRGIEAVLLIFCTGRILFR